MEPEKGKIVKPLPGGYVSESSLMYGAIAQLVERHNGIVEVAGSTPAGSTRPEA